MSHRHERASTKAGIGATTSLKIGTENSAKGTLWTFLAAIILCGLVPIAFIFSTEDRGTMPWRLALVIVTLAGLRLASLVGIGQPRLMSLSIWIFTYVFLGLAPLVQLRTGTFPSTTPGIYRSTVGPALVVVMVGSIALAIGELLPRRTRHISVTTHQSSKGIRVLGLIAIALTAFWVSRVGLGSIITSRFELARAEARAFPNPTSAAVFHALGSMPALVVMVAILVSPGAVKNHKFLGIAIALALILAFNPISAARYATGTALFAVVAAAGIYAKRWRFRVTALGAVALFTVGFSSLGTARADGASGYRRVGVLEGLTTGDYDSFAQICNSVFYVAQEGIANGFQLLGALLFWVPRAIWSSKPLDTGIALANARGYDFVNLSAPLWSEYYINGGMAFLIIAMLLTGFMTSRMDDRIQLAMRDSSAPGVLLCIVPGYMLIVLRGSLLQAMANLAVILVAGMALRKLSQTSGASRVSSAATGQTISTSKPAQ